MEWLFKPKVQLGLLVNFIFVMFTLVSSSAGSHRQSTRVLIEEPRGVAVEERHGVAAVETIDDNKFRYVQLPPRRGPSQATSYRDQQSGQLSVYTTQELTLVRKDGRALTLWPVFYVNGPSIVPPRKVLLRFTSKSTAQLYKDECELEIRSEAGTYLWQALPVTHESAKKGGARGVVERLETDIPYSVFLKLVTSKSVTLRVGVEEIPLTESQMSALRDMQRCIQDGVCS
jgi:hypothetical protein